MKTTLKKDYILNGLDCAHCAQNIETEVNKLPFVENASVSFVQKKLSLEISKENISNDEIPNFIKKIEPNIYPEEAQENTHDEHHHQHNFSLKNKILQLSLGAILFLAALFLEVGFWQQFLLYVLSYLIIGGEILLKAGRNIIRGKVFDENFLMSIATIGAFAIQEFPEGVAVMLFYQVGELFQSIAVNNSRKSISALMDIRPDFAHLKVNNTIQTVSPHKVKIGDVIIVKPGEKIPLDGVVILGQGFLDTKALTGESLPKEVKVGDEVLSGSINTNGVLTLKVKKLFGESTVSKILDLVQNASHKKSQTENFITKFARYYTPVVVVIALLIATIPPLLISGATFSDWTYRGLVFLVVSCPCALVISIPLGFFGGIGSASRNGILVKGSNYLEALNTIDTIVFDKTGTLTKGIFQVTHIQNAGSFSKEEILEFAAYTESFSKHPIAISIRNAYNKEIDQTVIKNYEEISGFGIKVEINEKKILAGNAKLLQKENIIFEESSEVGTLIYIAVSGKYAGYIIIADTIKEDAKSTLASLKNLGIRKTVLLTGDNKKIGEKIGKELEIDEIYTELLPDGKVEKLEILNTQKLGKGNLVFVGDGINDAPVLAYADIGIAMGGIGSDAAIEAADIVLMNDELKSILTAIEIAKKTRQIVWQNIFFALSVKLIVIILGAGGIATIWEAVFADVGVTLLAIINSMRIMRK
ncbi:MAG: heavy metal translocating P-type ATPase [Candidatus Altimarinota bacterium]